MPTSTRSVLAPSTGFEAGYVFAGVKRRETFLAGEFAKPGGKIFDVLLAEPDHGMQDFPAPPNEQHAGNVRQTVGVGRGAFIGVLEKQWKADSVGLGKVLRASGVVLGNTPDAPEVLSKTFQ